ncbi:MAG: hypothetical protein WC415_02180 [Patescibacteria group bacterium]|jgi:hypothetical protein
MIELDKYRKEARKKIRKNNKDINNLLNENFIFLKIKIKYTIDNTGKTKIV